MSVLPPVHSGTVTISTRHALSALGEPASRESTTWIFECGCVGRRRALRVDLIRRCREHRVRPPRLAE